MYPNGGDLVSQSSSMSKAVDDQQQQQQCRQLLHNYYYQHEPQPCHSPISAFRNLTLSHHSPPENRMSNLNRLVDAAAYLPQTLDEYSPIPRARNGLIQPIGNNNMMTYSYYPPMSPPSPCNNIGGQQVLPNLYNSSLGVAANCSPNLASFPCNMQYPAVSSRLPTRLYPNTVPLQGLYPEAEVERRLITIDMLPNILHNPYDYMTDSSLNRSLNTFLSKFSSSKFIDEFVIAITMSKKCLVTAACNYYGSNLIQTLIKCLDYMVDDFKAVLLARIALFAKHLALDVYGTYIVQHVLDLQTEHTEQIVKCLLPFLEVLCTTKNGSHLVEKCLDTHSSLVIKELVEKHKLVRLALHECANYVIQKAIKCSRGGDSKLVELHEKLIKILLKERNALQVNKHGKYVSKLLPGHQV